MAVFLANERSRLVFKDCRHHGPRCFGTVRAFPAAAIGSTGRDRVVLGMVQEPSSNTTRTGRALREPHTRGQTPHTHTLQHDERIVLQWLCQQSGRHMHVNVPVLRQNNHGAIFLAAYRCRLDTQGAEDALRWAKSTWKAARLGPCQRCQTPTQKRLCLVATRLCARCSLATAIAG